MSDTKIERDETKLIPMGENSPMGFSATRPKFRGSRLITILAASLALGACTHNANVRVADEARYSDAAKAQGLDSLHAMGRRLAADGNHSAAIPLYRAALQKHPFDDVIRSDLGISLQAVGEYGEAGGILEDAVEDEESGSDALVAYGNNLLINGDAKNALMSYTQAVNMGGGVSAFVGQGIAYDVLGQHGDALGAFDRALSLNADDLPARTNMGLSLSLAGDTISGVPMLEDVVRDPDAGPRHRLNLALAYTLAGNIDKARRIASIDLGLAELNSTMAYYVSYEHMASDERMAALLAGSRNPEWDRRLDGNRSHAGDEDAKRAGVNRFFAEPVQAEAAIPSIPPLMEPEGWAVQVAAYRTKEELGPGWVIISAKYRDIIGHLEPRRSEVDFGGRTQYPYGAFYRLNAGPLASYEEAADICDRLIAIGGECWIRPPEPAEGRLPGDS